MLIADHLNLTGRSPLIGPGRPPTSSGPASCDLTDCWSPRLRALARSVDPTLTEGVYAGLPGPQYETPAEIRMLQTLGADLVGMSTVWEAIAARHLGAEVLGLSLVTNLAAGPAATLLDHADVLAAGRAATTRMGRLLAEVVARTPARSSDRCRARWRTPRAAPSGAGRGPGVAAPTTLTPSTRAGLQALLDGLPATSRRAAGRRFAGRLQFGTAGLRGAVGAGPDAHEPGDGPPGRRRPGRVTWPRHAAPPAPARADVVVGFDARHGSADFAEDAARVLAAAGLRVAGAARRAADAGAGLRRAPPRAPTPA